MLLMAGLQVFSHSLIATYRTMVHYYLLVHYMCLAHCHKSIEILELFHISCHLFVTVSPERKKSNLKDLVCIISVEILYKLYFSKCFIKLKCMRNLNSYHFWT